jgi:two-component system cell cycle response regulator DivK
MPTQTSISGQVILIIDDDDEVMEAILSMHGAQVHVARDGADAITLLRAIVPTVICLDLNLPEVDGYETLRMIRQEGAWASIPVIAVTATPLLGVRQAVDEAGFDGYLAKPYSVRALLTLIETCAAQRM